MLEVLKVWLLVVHAGSGVPILVDDIASREQCDMLGRQIVTDTRLVTQAPVPNYRCYQVEKAPRG